MQTPLHGTTHRVSSLQRLLSLIFTDRPAAMIQKETSGLLRDLLFDSGAPETFTLYFAGNGGVTCGSFYMWVRNAEGRAQSVSALPLADIFR